MTWNYRIMRKIIVDKTGATETQYGIVEAYYSAKGDVIPHSWTENFCSPFGETIDDLIKDFSWMMAALRLPILDHNGAKCEPATMLADDIQKWVDAMCDVQGEA